MEQDVRFCHTPDGARIAYAVTGDGPALVWTPWLVSHLELDWEDPAKRAFFERLSLHHTVVRYDRYGCGLSDRDRTDFSLQADLRCLEAVTDHLRLKRFALLGGSQGGPPAIAYAVTHPRSVSRLLLYATFARRVPEERELRDAVNALILAHWGLGSQLMADRMAPGADAAQREQIARYQRDAATPQMAVSLRNFLQAEGDIRNLCSRVKSPTLVLHRRGDPTVPFERGREVAASIPKARLLALEGELHGPWTGDADAILRAIHEFLGDSTPAVSHTPRTRTDGANSAVALAVTDAAVQGLLGRLDVVSLDHHQVVPGYVRYDEQVRQGLKDARQQILAGLDAPTGKRENHLVWGAPGSGKSYFVQRLAATLGEAVRYRELNLAGSERSEFVATLRDLQDGAGPCLCLVDEVDAQPEEAWPYEVLLPALDINLAHGSQVVLVLAGSSGSTIGEMRACISGRPKGADLLSRVPASNEYSIPPMGAGDRLLAALAQVRAVGRETSRELASVEKLALYYLASAPRVGSPRQLREAVAQAIARVPAGDDRVKYDHLFAPGDPENKAFWMAAQTAAGNLSGRFVTITD